MDTSQYLDLFIDETKEHLFNAHLALFQLPGASYNPYANQRHQNAEQRHASAFGANHPRNCVKSPS